MKLAALVVAVLAAGCSGGTAPAPTPAPAPAPAPGGPPAAAPGALDYPLSTCVVSGEALGEMGEPVVRMHEGVEVRFCCSNCIKEFEKDPKKYVAIIEAARKK